MPLNLVIDDPDFYYATVLQKLPYPYLYVNYVGWLSVALAIWGASLGVRGSRRRETIFLCLLALSVMWLASGSLFAFVAAVGPPSFTRQVAAMRYFPVMAGLAVPPILGLASLALDHALRRSWPLLQIGLAAGQRSSNVVLSLRWVLLPALLLALHSAYTFGRHWLVAERVDPQVPLIIAALATPSLEWVNTPFGEHFFVAPAVERGLKLALGVRPWNWDERPLPPALLEVYRQGPPADLTQVATVNGVPIYRGPPERGYARVIHADGSFTSCAASGMSGNLDIRCEAERPGRLVVHEYTWSGWRATLDGQRAALQGDIWLELDLPAGAHDVALRYRPWDVPLGLALALVGIILAGVQLLSPVAPPDMVS